MSYSTELIQDVYLISSADRDFFVKSVCLAFFLHLSLRLSFRFNSQDILLKTSHQGLNFLTRLDFKYKTPFKQIDIEFSTKFRVESLVRPADLICGRTFLKTRSKLMNKLRVLLFAQLNQFVTLERCGRFNGRYRSTDGCEVEQNSFTRFISLKFAFYPFPTLRKIFRFSVCRMIDKKQHHMK